MFLVVCRKSVSKRKNCGSNIYNEKSVLKFPFFVYSIISIFSSFEKFSRRILVTSVVMQRAYTRLHQTRTGFLTPLYVYPLHSGRRASKFDNSACGFVTRFASLNDRDFPFVDELDGFSFKYIKVSFMLALVTSRQLRVITTFYFSTFRCREIFYLYQIFSQKTTKNDING